MLTQEDDVEIHALARRGWSVSAIARHTGHDRKPVRKYLQAMGPSREPEPSCLEPFRDYLGARFADDVHVDGTVLFREVCELGFDRSYVTFVRQLRLLDLRPRCEACRTGGHGVTTVIAHEPGEEIQWDWLELTETPWGAPAYVLVGALSFSGKCRAVICEGMSFAHLVEGIDGVLRRLGGTSRAWRTDRMATVVYPGSDRITAQFAQVAKHYGVEIWVCPPRRPQRKGVVESAINYVTSSWGGGIYKGRGRRRERRRNGGARREGVTSPGFFGQLLGFDEELAGQRPVKPQRLPEDCPVDLVAFWVALLSRVQLHPEADILLDHELDAVMLFPKGREQQGVVACSDRPFRSICRESRRSHDVRLHNMAHDDRVLVEGRLEDRVRVLFRAPARRRRHYRARMRRSESVGIVSTLSGNLYVRRLRCR